MKPGDLVEVDLYEFYQLGADPVLGLIISNLPQGYRNVLLEGFTARVSDEEIREIQEGSYIFNNICKENFDSET
jgi:hypothetical protein